MIRSVASSVGVCGISSPVGRSIFLYNRHFSVVYPFSALDLHKINIDNFFFTYME